jgi:hypothetical protein
MLQQSTFPNDPHLKQELGEKYEELDDMVN